ncbi:MAG TPA: diguanylate cyclase [Nostocaceae cyanobacterium]|nr:diguanylate cyclase [Nostocaceae cyanobacterium]
MGILQIFNQIRKFFWQWRSRPGWLAMLIVICCQWLGMFQPLEFMAYNHLFNLRGSRNWDERVVVVAIDDNSLKELGQFPWQRRIYAQLLEVLDQAQPNVVVFDMIFSEYSHEQDDQLLAQAIGKHGRVVLARAWGYDKKKLLPLDEFTENALITAHIIKQNDPDGIIRKIYPQICGQGSKLVEKNGEDVISLNLPQKCNTDTLENSKNSQIEVFPSLAVAALEGYGTFADVPLLPNLEHPLWINWMSKIEQMPRFSLVDVVKGRISKQKLENKIILVGVTAFGIDSAYTPFDSEPPAGGVIIHSTLINNLLHKNLLNLFPVGGWVLLLIIAGPIFSWSIAHYPATRQIVICVVLCLAWLVCSLVMFNVNYWLPVAAPLILLGLTTGLILLRDRYQLKSENSHLQQLAIYDGLTQIPNRRYFDQYLQQEWQHLARKKSPLSLILCDVDFFKKYNDTYGHQAGDVCLQKVAQALSQAVKRPTDLAARYGGEEFALILPDTNIKGAEQVAENVRAQILALAIPHVGSQVNQCVTLSLGIATIIPTSDLLPTVVIKAADEALYKAKQSGRDRYTAIYLE